VEEKNVGGGGISLSCPKRACVQTPGRLRYKFSNQHRFELIISYFINSNSILTVRVV
jgi:hypothetical protein